MPTSHLETFAPQFIRRQKKKPVHRFTRVLNLEHNKEGTVYNFLDSQFTVNYEDGSFGFLFYKDKGTEWEPLDEWKEDKARRGRATLAQSYRDMFGEESALALADDTVTIALHHDTLEVELS